MKILLWACLLFPLAGVTSAREFPFQPGHTHDLLKVKFSPDNSRLISYSFDDGIYLWDVPSGRLLWRRRTDFIQKADEYYTLTSFAFSPDQTLIASGSGNGTVQLWDARTGKFLWRADAHKENVTAVEFSPDGKTIASAASPEDSADEIKLLRVDDGRVIRKLEGKPCTVVAMTFDRGGKHLLTGNLDGYTSGWDLKTGRQDRTAPVRPCGVHRTYEWEASFTPDLSTSAVRTGEKELTLKDARSGATGKKFEAEGYRIYSRFSADGTKLVVSGYGGFTFHDLVTGGNRKLDEFSPTGSTIDLSRDGSLFAEGGGGGDAAIKITETKTGKSRYLVGHPGVVKTIAYSPDGSHLAVAGSDRNIYVFDAAGRSLAHVLTGHVRPIDALAFNPDGQQLFSVDADETLKVWDWKKGEQIHENRSGPGIRGAKKVEFSKDGKYFLTLSEGALKIWDARGLKLLREIKTAEGYESTGGYMTLRYSGVPVTAAAFAGDGGRLLSTHADKTLRTWDALNGEQLASVDLGGETPFLCVSPDAKTVLAATGRGDKFRVRLLDVETGKELTTFDEERTGYVEALAISPDGRRFATSDISGDVLLWDVKKSRPVHELDIGYSGDDALAFSPDGKTLAVGGRNQNLFLFNVESGDKLWQLIPSYEPGDSEVMLTREKEQRQAKLNEQKALRDRQAAADAEVFGKQIYITFEHYGEMTDPGELRMVESDVPRQSKVKKPAAESSAVWLRLRNDSPLPIKIPTQSIYLPNPKCFFQLPGGLKVFGLCDGREISIWFGLEDKDGEALPYGFDFGSSAILLPKTSALFAVPREVLRGGNAVRFDYSFQKEDVDGKVADYGEEIMLRFRESDLPEM